MRRLLFPVVNVCSDKDDRRWPVVFNPMRSPAIFDKYLTGLKLFRRPVIVVVGENPVEDVDDRWIALVTMEPDMAARRHDRATDP